MSLRAILPVADVDVAKPTAANDRGPSPQLQWVKIAELVVDNAYQRPVSRKGIANIRAIAENFRWASFSPVVVSPVDGGRFAIVDGQHRTTAAALCGIEAVPCQVILATQDGQAEAFSQINGRTTRVHSMSLFRAAVTAGDPQALIVNGAATRAGVSILPYPKQIAEQKPNETMAVGAIAAAVREHGVDIAVLALQALLRPANAGRGVLVAPIIKAAARAASVLRRSRAPDAVLSAFDGVNVLRQLDAATAKARAEGGGVATALAFRLLEKMQGPGDRAVAGTAVAPAAAKPPVVRPPAPATSSMVEIVARAKAAVPAPDFSSKRG